MGVQASYGHPLFKGDCLIFHMLLYKLFVGVNPLHILDAHFSNCGQKPVYMYVHGIFFYA